MTGNDIDGEHCAASDCFEPAATLVRVIVEPMTDPDRPLTLGVPLCHDHAGLLRYPTTSLRIET